MKIAIIGFPGSGKSTVFKAITDPKNSKEIIDPSKPAIGTVKVKDERLDRLFDIFKPKKKTPEEFVFTDLPGFSVNNFKTYDTLINVVGVFSGRDCLKDINDMEAEFFVSDLVSIEKKLETIDKEIKAKPSIQKELEKKVLLKCKEKLDTSKPLRGLELTPEEAKAISGYQFLSKKPLLNVANLDEMQISSGKDKEMIELCLKNGIQCISLCGNVEAEIQDLDEKERLGFANEMGIKELCRDRVIKAARELAGVIDFFTGSDGGEEVRAWPIEKGTNASEAAGKIHTDLKQGFIRAEVVAYADFIKCGSFQESKNKGVFRLEGKEYIVKDGDIITFRSNV